MPTTRVGALPRDVAATIITGAMSRAAWVVGAVSLLLTIPPIIEFLVTRGLDHLLVPAIAILVILAGLATLGAAFPRPVVALIYLGVGAVLGTLLQVIVISAHPEVLNDGLFIINRPTVSLVLVGAVAASAWIGLLWSAAGFIVALGASAVVALSLGTPFSPGWGALLLLIVLGTTYAALAGIQHSQRSRVPSFAELDRRMREVARDERLRSRVTAAVHDSLLNDLSILINAPDVLDERTRDRLRSDLVTLTSADWLRETADVAVDEQDAALRNEIMLIVSDLQWRGLTVHVTGAGPGIYRLAPDVATTLVDVVRACLENALRHSGAAVAEINLNYSTDALTVTVTDSGVGFDLEAIPPDRLGLRASIVDRVESVGGVVKIWTAPGAGTSIIMTLPVLQVIATNDKATRASN